MSSYDVIDLGPAGILVRVGEDIVRAKTRDDAMEVVEWLLAERRQKK